MAHGGTVTMRKPARRGDRLPHHAAGLERRRKTTERPRQRHQHDTVASCTHAEAQSTCPAIELQAKPEVFLDLIRRQQRGRLKIYLGFAAGVGKTYDMLQEGNRLRRQGVDVVIGFVETHGRAGNHRPDRRAGTGALPPDRISRHRAGGNGPRRRARPPAHHRPGRRVGPHQRPRQPQSQTLPGRRGNAPRRHQRHHHAEHPALGEPARHRGTGDRRARQGAPSRLRGHHGRPDRQRRSFCRRPARAARWPARSIPPSGCKPPWRTSSRPRNSTQLRELAMEEIAFRLDRSRREDEQRAAGSGPRARSGSWSA